jgi:hypothetical protein
VDIPTNWQTTEPLPPGSKSVLIGLQPIVCSGIWLDGNASATWTGSLNQTVRGDIRRARQLGVSVRLVDSINLKSFAVNLLKDCRVRGESRGPRLVRAVMRRVPKATLKILGEIAFKHMG